MEAKREVALERFEFVLYKNDNIICQRYVNIPNYNKKCIKSLEFKDMMDNIAGLNNGAFGYMGIIPKYLKNKSMEYMWSEYNPYSETPEDPINIKRSETTDNFIFQVIVDKRVVGKSIIDGNLFPHRGKTGIDIKAIVKDIYSEMKYNMSLNNYTNVYDGVTL